jgi:hypothetical protein
MSQTAAPHSPIEEVADFFARGPSLAEIARFQLSEAAQSRINELLEREDDGALNKDERRQLDELVTINDLVMLIRSRALPGSSSSSTGASA